jgi:hypothetical protein
MAHEKTLLLAGAAALLFGVVVYLATSPLPQGRAPAGFAQAFREFADSQYLQERWSQVCTYDLRDSANIVLLARLNQGGETPEIACWWNINPTGVVNGAGLSTDDTITNMDAAWLDCDKDIKFAQKVSDGLYERSRLVYLGDRPSQERRSAYFILAAKCHDQLCICPGNSDIPSDANVTSIAYAVMDARTGEVFW